MNWNSPFYKRGRHSKRNKIDQTSIVAVGICSLFLLLVVSVGSLSERARLDSTQRKLRISQLQLAKIKSDNAQQDQREAELKAELVAKKAALEGISAQLASSEGHAKTQGENVTVLKSCLDGVTLALVEVKNNDVGRAQEILAGVQEPCKKSEALL